MYKKAKSINIESIELRAQALCARQEKCSADVRLKLIQWGVSKNDAEVIIRKLVKDGFINDTRYAEIFVREKSRFNKWGMIKISQALRIKGIADNIVKEALNQVEQKTEEESLTILLSKKIHTIKASSPYELKSKLIRYALSKGYKYEEVLRIASKMVKEDQ